ncbi:hypothetical protein PRK78_004941 [Emydomyces testavorans]|uniref:Uncharacterized protein n=1 Tax=Emydomyces testavorans TaxID=2070801 RepID=A0AAF0DKT6_9EURO|nr:hypothetical protein PRK78_004941 [Emydomyces testavorans]
MTRPMSEAQNRCAHLPETTEDTFIQFSQFLYSGDYGVGRSGLIAGSGGLYTELLQEVDTGQVASKENTNMTDSGDCSASRDDNWIKPKFTRKRNSGSVISKASPSERIPLWMKFKTLKYNCRNPTTFSLGINRDSKLNMLLSHAKLYVFADMYQIDELRELSLHKLHERLCNSADVYIPHVLELLRYTHENTVESTRQVDPLRAMVLQYVTCLIEHLAHVPEFQSLVQEFGSLSTSLITSMLTRLD